MKTVQHFPVHAVQCRTNVMRHDILHEYIKVLFLDGGKNVSEGMTEALYTDGDVGVLNGSSLTLFV